jgi:ABC-type lipoprotein release transport system permease subunit
VGLLALLNVRERRDEIGILRALGTSARRIFSLFVTRSLMSGLGGAVLGYLAGYAWGVAWLSLEGPGEGAAIPPLISGWLVLAVLGLALLVSAAGALLPAMIAAQQDPAQVLREE